MWQVYDILIFLKQVSSGAPAPELFVQLVRRQHPAPEATVCLNNHIMKHFNSHLKLYML